MDQVTRFKIHVATTRTWLHGRGFFKAMKALEFARSLHTGMRKDGKTPEFFHQVRIVGYLRTLEGSLMYPEETFATGFLHDVCEDHGVSFGDIERDFGPRVRDAVERLTKKQRGVVRPDWIECLHHSAIASIVKMADRSDNIQTMKGVFTAEKQRRYIEVGRQILDMGKNARRAFPEQLLAYENAKYVLKSQIALVEAYLDAGVA